jgi:hypothetical protein
VWEILKKTGIDPAPRLTTPCNQRRAWLCGRALWPALFWHDLVTIIETGRHKRELQVFVARVAGDVSSLDAEIGCHLLLAAFGTGRSVNGTG